MADSSPPAASPQQDTEAILQRNRQTVNRFVAAKLEREAAKNWDKFYKRHQDKFFHDRHWTDREFEALRTAVAGAGEDQAAGDTEDVLMGSLTSQGAPVLLEVGCGVGNMLYPLLDKVTGLKVHCCDFSPNAIDIVKNHPKYTPERVNAFVFDLIQEEPSLASFLQIPPSLPPPPCTSSDFGPPTLVSVIFVLSAIPPKHHVRVLQSLFALVEPGGALLFRDYGRGDLAQLRFHSREAWAEPNLLSSEHDQYKRGDGTMTFFFAESYLRQLGQELGDQVDTSEIKIVERVGFNRKKGIELRRYFAQAYWKKKKTEAAS